MILTLILEVFVVFFLVQGLVEAVQFNHPSITFSNLCQPICCMLCIIEIHPNNLPRFQSLKYEIMNRFAYVFLSRWSSLRITRIPLTLRRPESRGRRRGSGRTMVTWSRTTLSRWSRVRLFLSLCVNDRIPISSLWERELAPPVLPAPRGVAMATVLRSDNGCSFLLLLPLSCLCFLVLFSKEEVGPQCPPPPLSDAAQCNPLYGPVWSFIKTSQHLGSRVLRCPITCSLDLSFHHSHCLS